jgi:hypothetical protein
MGTTTSGIDLDWLWEEGAGTIDCGNGIMMTYDVRPKMTKEQWKKEFMKSIMYDAQPKRKWYQFWK